MIGMIWTRGGCYYNNIIFNFKISSVLQILSKLWKYWNHVGDTFTYSLVFSSNYLCCMIFNLWNRWNHKSWIGSFFVFSMNNTRFTQIVYIRMEQILRKWCAILLLYVCGEVNRRQTQLSFLLFPRKINSEKKIRASMEKTYRKKRDKWVFE